MNNLSLQPRIIRAGQAYGYCGMCERMFNKHIRPYVTVIEIGKQGKGFDRIEIDLALDDYITRYGSAPKLVREEQNQCEKEELQVLGSSTESGISIKPSTANDFAKAVARAKNKKLKNC